MRKNMITQLIRSICIFTITGITIFIPVTMNAQNSPPFVLSNDPSPETSTWIHSGNGYINQVVHPDILYFHDGWGNVNGESFNYWMGVTGYYYGNEKYEQPAVVVSNNISNNSWQEPAGNIYNTNPVSGYAWPFGSAGHYSDIDIVYNDDTDEIWSYFRNKDRDIGKEWFELYKTADGVNWEAVSHNILEPSAGEFLLSPSVIKDGKDWWMWTVEGSTSPNRMLRYHSSDGINWSLDSDTGYEFRTSEDRDPWHIDVVQYNDEYWGFLVECALDTSSDCDLALIKSPDGVSWTGYDSPILDIAAGSWDDSTIYRSSFVIEDGFLEGIYTANGSDGSWYAGYTSYDGVGGSGSSSNVITNVPEPSTILLIGSGLIGLAIYRKKLTK